MPADKRRDRPFFTVFTPTYNRAHLLPRVFDSLTRQTDTDFEWLVIDDGSRDNTTELVAGWAASTSFPVRYLRQDNRGKHVAFNRAVREAAGQLICPLDSDDSCVPNALERFRHHWTNIPQDQREHYVGVTCHCADPTGAIVGRPLPAAVLDSDAREIYYRHGVRGELWGAVRRDVMLRFPFPETVERVYVPEGVVWFAIARTFKSRYVREALRIYHPTPNSLGSGAALTPEAADSLRVTYLMALNDDWNYVFRAPGWFARAAVHFVRFSRHTGRSWQDCLASVTGPARALVTAAVPAGLLLHAVDRRRAAASTHRRA